VNKEKDNAMDSNDIEQGLVGLFDEISFYCSF
jgi:hypothetical protein